MSARARGAKPLAADLFWWDLVDGMVVNDDGTAFYILELQGIDPTCADNESVNSLNNALASLLRNAPHDSTIQLRFVVSYGNATTRRAISNTWKAPIAPLQYLRDKLNEQIAEDRGVRDVRIFMCTSAGTTFRPTGQKGKRFPEVTRAEHEKLSTENRNFALWVQTQLANGGIATCFLTDREILPFLYRCANPGSRAMPVRSMPQPLEYYFDQAGQLTTRPVTLSSVVADGHVQEARDQFYSSNAFHSIMSLSKWPAGDYVHALNLLSVVNMLSFPVELVVHVRAVGKDKALNKLQVQSNTSEMFAGLTRWINRDRSGSLLRSDTEQLLQAITADQTALCFFGMQFVLTADSQDELHEQQRLIQAAVARLDSAGAQVELYHQFPAWLWSLPGGTRYNPDWPQTTTEVAACLLPVYDDALRGRTCLTPLRTYTNGLFSFAPFEHLGSDGKNITVIGSTGSGKSNLVNQMLLGAVASEANVIICDVGGSYKRLVTTLGGQNVSLDLANGTPLCPTYTQAEMRDADGGLNAQKLIFTRNVLARLVVGADEGRVDQLDEHLLGRVVEATYHNLAKKEAPKSDPLIEDFLIELERWREKAGDAEDRERAAGLAKRLERWTSGVKGRTLNQRSALRLTNNLTSIDFQGVNDDPDLAAVAFLIVTQIIADAVIRAKHEGRPTFIIFDECWVFLKDPVAGVYIAGQSRTIRKEGGLICVVSQGIDDFLSPVSKPILEQSSIVFVGRHKANRELVAETLRMNQREKALFEQLPSSGGFRDFFAIYGSKRTVIRSVLHPYQYWLTTSDAKDRRALDELRPSVAGQLTRELGRDPSEQEIEHYTCRVAARQWGIPQ